jgi:hypothetical protein
MLWFRRNVRHAKALPARQQTTISVTTHNTEIALWQLLSTIKAAAARVGHSLLRMWLQLVSA